jgi:Mg-chelatase subunit ChlD
MTYSVRFAVLGLAASLTIAGFANRALSHPKPNERRIEIAFVLDTTGSMANLIDGAKRKIWSIANSIVDVNPDAEIRMALIGYRDIGDEYVVKSFDMNDDIQGLYGNLTRFVADGGGDTPESVNEALDAGVRKLNWSSDPDVRRIVFLVGDAPPHMDYANGPKYRDVVAKARDRSIVINTVQAGADPETTQYWQEMARLGEGKYFAIPQDGGQVQVINSPFDDEIIRIQGKIDATITIYGSKEQRIETQTKLGDRAAAPVDVQVENSKFYSKKGGPREVMTGGGDLIDDVRNNRRAIDEIADKELPPELQGKSKTELQAYIEARSAERTMLEADMAELIKRRDAYVADQVKKQPVTNADSFDRSVSEALSAQF